MAFTPSSFSSSCWRHLSTLGLFGLFGAVASAQLAVNSITTSSVNQSNQTINGESFNRRTTSITSFKDVAGNIYDANSVAGSAYVRRNTDPGNANNSSVWYDQGTTTDFEAPYATTYSSLLLGNNILRGSDNTFANGTGVSEGNIERLDFLFSIDQLNASADHTVTVGGRKRDPNAFIDQLTGDAVVMYSAGQSTPTKTLKRVGPSALGHEVLTFTNFYGRLPIAGETWWQPLPEDAAGDGTVPLVSSLGQFEKDTNPKVKRVSLTLKDDKEALDHLGIVWNSASQKIVLQELGVTFTESNISRYSAAG